MAMSLRFFALPEEGGIKQVPRALCDQMLGGRTIPEFAGRRVRIAEAVIEMEGRRPIRLIDVRGSYWSFDENGEYQLEHEGLRYAFSKPQPRVNEAVVDISPVLEHQRWQGRYRWSPSADEMEMIIQAIWPQMSDAERIAAVKGGGLAPQPVSSDAQRALRTIGEAAFSIQYALADLSEHALKGVSYDLRRQAANFKEEAAIALGVANRADQIREIKARRRTGKGTWYAVIEVFRWDQRDRSGTSIMSAAEPCEGRERAVEKAREMLSQNAHHFGRDTTVEASITTDLEWDEAKSVRE